MTDLSTATREELLGELFTRFDYLSLVGKSTTRGRNQTAILIRSGNAEGHSDLHQDLELATFSQIRAKMLVENMIINAFEQENPPTMDDIA